MKGGDENIVYIHACLKERRMQNQVYMIQNVVGEWKEDMKGIEEAFMQYYEGLLGTDDTGTIRELVHVGQTQVQ